MKAEKKQTYNYHIKVGNKIVLRGTTLEIDRRDMEHLRTWADPSITHSTEIEKLGCNLLNK